MHASSPWNLTYYTILLSLLSLSSSSYLYHRLLPAAITMSSSRRHENLSDESQMSSSLRFHIQLANQLSSQLDEAWNDSLERQLSLSKDLSDAEVLMNVLSPHSTISLASSFGVFHQSRQGVMIGYRAIGFGQCGLVFERPGRGYVVKVSKPAYEDALWDDFHAHFCVRQAFAKGSLECRVPCVYSFVRKDNQQWWDENKPFFENVHETFSLPAMALITEHILPLPKVARRALINTYCPPSLQSTVSANPVNRDCLARIYLGRRRPADAQLSPNFTLRNYNLTLDQILDLNLSASSFASAMGEALATIHWSANVDAYDIEFVLGSEGDITYSRDVSLTLNLTPEMVFAMPRSTDIEGMMSVNFKRRTTRMWVLDFNLCTKWEEKVGWENPDGLISQLVMAFFENDPYYPLPLMDLDIDKELWETFSSKYLETGSRIVSGKDERLVNLPRKFIGACVQREQANLDRKLGHGHRDFKD